MLTADATQLELISMVPDDASYWHSHARVHQGEKQEQKFIYSPHTLIQDFVLLLNSEFQGKSRPLSP